MRAALGLQCWSRGLLTLLGKLPARVGVGVVQVSPSSLESAPKTFLLLRSLKKAVSVALEVRTTVGCTRLSALFTSTGLPHLLWSEGSDMSIKGALGGPVVVQYRGKSREPSARGMMRFLSNTPFLSAEKSRKREGLDHVTPPLELCSAQRLSRPSPAPAASWLWKSHVTLVEVS
jgi:hypothetical protein